MAEMWISMGPQHPMTHGLWTLKVKVDGETIVDADPELGYLHRSVEKMGERRKYFMNTTLTDRLCYASSTTWTHCYVNSVEELMICNCYKSFFKPTHLFLIVTSVTPDAIEISF